MILLLSLLGLGMVAIGIAAMLFGSPIIQVERGWTMVISGSVGASGGAVLLGIVFVAHRLGRIAREMVQIRDRVGEIEEVAQIHAGGEEADEPEAVPAAARPNAPQGAELTIVGRYASGGSSYVMYSDGSIQADLPGGPRRFASIEDLRAYMARS